MIGLQILSKLKRKGVRCFACDNISDYLDGNDLEEIETDLTHRLEGVLKEMIIDIENDPNSKETARRLAKMYLHEVFRGRYYPQPVVKSFPNTGEHAYKGMLVERAEIRSVCAHHWQPVTGVAFVGIIPNGEVIGLSKYMRLAQWCAQRGTLQEELTNQIADEIMKATKCDDVAVHIRAEHGCMTNRGVRAHSSLTQTTVLRGHFQEADVKKEFFDCLKMQVFE